MNTSPRTPSGGASLEGVGPTGWPWALETTPALSSDRTAWRGALLRAWSGTSPVMVQPPLDHHYVVMHLGGAKRVNRRRDGVGISAVAEPESLTLVPAGTAYVWNTEGPIAFAHLYLRPAELEAICEAAPERAGRGAALIDRVGCRDPVLEATLKRMLQEIRCIAAPSKLLLDSLFESFCVRLARQHMARTAAGSAEPVAMAPHRLRRVLDFVEAHLGRDIGLADLVEAAGTSQYHFSRAFHLATGASPYRYLLRRRIEHARVLLMTSEQSLEAVSRACGFNSKRQFSTMFTREVGTGPKRFRMARR